MIEVLVDCLSMHLLFKVDLILLIEFLCHALVYVARFWAVWVWDLFDCVCALVDCLSTQSRPILYLPPPPDQPPPTDIGMYSPTDEHSTFYSYQPRNILTGAVVENHVTAGSEIQLVDTDVHVQQLYLGTDNNMYLYILLFLLFNVLTSTT